MNHITICNGIEVEGLPSNCKAVAYRVPKKEELYYSKGKVIKALFDMNAEYLIVIRLHEKFISQTRLREVLSQFAHYSMIGEVEEELFAECRPLTDEEKEL